MTIHDDLNRAENAIRELENAVLCLRADLGPHIDVLRLADDAARCAIDLRRLADQTSSVPHRVPLQEVVVIPDEEYDMSLWAGVDVESEGLGAPGRRAP